MEQVPKNHSPNGDVGLGCTIYVKNKGIPLAIQDTNTIMVKKGFGTNSVWLGGVLLYTSLYLHRLMVPHSLHPAPPSPVDSHIPPCMAEYTPLEDWHSWHTSEDMHWHTPAAPSPQCRHQSQYLICRQLDNN